MAASRLAGGAAFATSDAAAARTAVSKDPLGKETEGAIETMKHLVN
jgi:hypothetical protein